VGYKSTIAKGDKNSSLSFEHRHLVTNAVAETVTKKTVTMLPPDEEPWVVSLFGVVPKRGTDKLRLTVSMRYVNRHLGQKAFKFEELKDLADYAEKEDYAVSYDFMSGY